MSTIQDLINAHRGQPGPSAAMPVQSMLATPNGTGATITRNVATSGPQAPTYAQPPTQYSVNGDLSTPNQMKAPGPDVSGPTPALAANAGQYGPALSFLTPDRTAAAGNVMMNARRQAVSSADPAGEMVSGSGFLGGLQRIGAEAGGGAAGAGAATGEALWRGIRATGEHLLTPVATIGGVVGDFARGMVGMRPMGEADAAAKPAARPISPQIMGGGMTGADDEVMASMRGAPAPAPVISGKAGGTLPTGVAYDPATKTYSNVPQVAGAQGSAPQPSPFTGNVIQTAKGGGYTGVGFTAGADRATPGGAALSAALRAAADRGDTDALIRHYGSFNGETAASSRADALTRQAMTLPPGSKRRAGIMSEVAALQAGEAAKATGALAARKQSGEEAKILGEVGKLSAEQQKAAQEAQNIATRRSIAEQLARLDDKTDPDFSKREALISQIAALEGKAQDPKFVLIDEEIGPPDPITGKVPTRKVAVNARTGEVKGAPKPVKIGPTEFKRLKALNPGIPDEDLIADVEARGGRVILGKK